ncbi:MAG: hypothetical protein L6Q99_09380 [Planctomycetes bacterium]|nr:hypothetical protein [Planctomycetota bacterium]
MVIAQQSTAKPAERSTGSSVSGSIRAVIRRATWKARGVTFVEAACAGVAASALTASVARLQGSDELALGALCAAALSGVAVAATWWVEHRPDAARIARRVDRELAQDGALVTAFELEAREERNVLDELLLLRACAGLEPRRVSRAIAPPSLVFAGAALCASAVWFGVRELVHVRVPTPLERLLADARGFVAGSAEHPTSSSAANAAGASRSSLEAARLEVARVAARVRDELARGREPESELAGGLARELASELASALERAAEAADGTDASGADAAALRKLADRARSVSARRPSAARSDAPAPPSNGGDSASALANGGAERTIPPFGSAADAASEVPPAEPAPPTGEPSAAAASLAGRWWSARHDAVVSAWIEARRARAARSPNEDESK